MLKIVCRKDGRILGATIVSSSARELIHELAIVIRKNMTVQELSGMIHAYPTMSSSLWNL
jgi:pyruvate/2-oxoglutarate dehydrogenase complex dihydrolipoamide dehydrogenase (E3) component